MHIFVEKYLIFGKIKCFIWSYDLKAHAASEDSDQPVHQRSLIRDFINSMCLLQNPGYPKRPYRSFVGPKLANVYEVCKISYKKQHGDDNESCNICRVVIGRTMALISSV